MAPRAIGALLATVAAIAFVVSIASSSWWSGHPNVEGHTITAKNVRVGLLGATGCNTGGDGRCEAVEVGGGLQMVGLVELAAIGVATVLAFMLAVSAWRIGDRRRTIAHVTIGVVAIAAVGAVGVLVIGPSIKATQQVAVPIGWGTFVFVGATLAALGASAITRTLKPEPLRLKPSAHAPLQTSPSVRDMVREQHDGLRPSSLGPEPVLGAGHTYTGPRASAPLIGGAPQLRPLYEATNDGYVPPPTPPPLPLEPPARLSKAVVDQIQGNTTPAPSLTSTWSHAGGAPPIPPTPRPPVAPARPRTPSSAPARAVSADELASGWSLGAMPARTAASENRSTTAHSVPPMPAGSGIRAGGQRLATDVDDRLDKAMRPTESLTAVEIDAEGKAAAAANGAPLGDVTDTNLQIEVKAVPDTAEHAVVDAPPTPIPTVAPTGAKGGRAATPLPVSTAPPHLAPPKSDDVAAAGPTPACPQCEAPMAWVEEHLRFYCKQCRMYF